MPVVQYVHRPHSGHISLQNFASRTSVNCHVMLYTSACECIGCIVQMDIFEIMYRACRSTGNAACMPNDFPTQACCPDVCSEDLATEYGLVSR